MRRAARGSQTEHGHRHGHGRPVGLPLCGTDAAPVRRRGTAVPAPSRDFAHRSAIPWILTAQLVCEGARVTERSPGTVGQAQGQCWPGAGWEGLCLESQ